MANRRKKAAAQRSDAEAVLHDYERALTEVIGDRIQLLAGALEELRAMRERETSLRHEVERLMAETVAKDTAREQLWQALFDLRQWHKVEYQSNRQIDAQADTALTLFSPAKPGVKPN